MRLARRLLLASWCGALIAQTALTAPTLFAVVADRRLAATIAGELFRRLTWASVAIALLLAVAALWSEASGGGRRQAAWLLAPAGVLLASEYAVRPLLVAARVAGGAGFAFWHGVSTALYILAVGIVVGLTIRELRR